VGRYHERLLTMERELERHQKDKLIHCDEKNCECRKN